MTKIITYTVYVIEIDDDPKRVYVGQTYLSPKKRLEQHKNGIHSARSIRHAKKLTLRPDLYAHLPSFKSREAVLRAEEHHAKYLESQGFTVKGGH